MAGTRGFSRAFGLRLVAAGAACGLLLAASVQAQQKLQADPKANPANQPAVTTPTTGKAPVVNIVTPGQGGVSHNVWKDYNVGKEGIVFNNATQAGQSQLLGQMGANPNLANGTYAKLILNEVTGGNLSQLLGYTEIFGHSADFILANPAGVTCNGCGFINTPRVTLTTGTPDFGQDGAFKGFSVSGSGSIRFEGAGADISGLQTFDVVSRSIFMGGAIDDAALAADVGLFAGRNSFDYAARTVTSLADDGSKKPGYAIDTNAAGAIRAGKIGVTSTEKGVAARTAADMQAGAGGMMLTADGKLVIAKAKSQGTIRAKSLSSDIQVAGQLWSQATLELRAAGNISVLSQASAGALGNVSIDAQGITLNSGAVIGAGLDDQGKLTGNGALNLYAANLTNAGTIEASQDVTLGLSGVLNNQGTGLISAGQALNVSAAQVANAGSLAAQGALSANIAAGSGGDGSFANQGTASGASVAVNAGSLSNTGMLSAQGALQASTTGGLSNTATVSGQTLNLAAGGTLSTRRLVR
jgi:filamentous hemagglutinin